MIFRNNIKTDDEVVCMNWSGVIYTKGIKYTISDITPDGFILINPKDFDPHFIFNTNYFRKAYKNDA